MTVVTPEMMNVRSVVFKYHAFFILAAEGQIMGKNLMKMPPFHIPLEIYGHYNL